MQLGGIMEAIEKAASDATKVAKEGFEQAKGAVGMESEEEKRRKAAAARFGNPLGTAQSGGRRGRRGKSRRSTKKGRKSHKAHKRTHRRGHKGRKSHRRTQHKKRKGRRNALGTVKHTLERYL